MQHASYNLEWKFKEETSLKIGNMTYITLVVLRRSPRCWVDGRLIERTNFGNSPDYTKLSQIELETTRIMKTWKVDEEEEGFWKGMKI